jgi:hypothetical protein
VLLDATRWLDFFGLFSVRSLVGVLLLLLVLPLILISFVIAGVRWPGRPSTPQRPSRYWSAWPASWRCSSCGVPGWSLLSARGSATPHAAPGW